MKSPRQTDADFDGLSEEAFPQDLPMDEVTRPENAVRAAAGRAQRLRAPDVFRNKRGLFGGIRTRGLADAVAAPGQRRRRSRNLNPTSEGCECVCFPVTHLKDLRFSELSSRVLVLSRTASEGEDSRMRDVAGAPRWVLGEPSLSLSKRCLTGSYSISRCRV